MHQPAVITCMNVKTSAGELPGPSRSIQQPQIIARIGDRLEEGADDITAVDLPTIGAGVESLGMDTLPDFAGGQAMGEFHPFHPAAGAVDGFRGNRRTLKHDAPFGSYFFAQLIIVGQGGFAGIACITVDATT